MLRHAALSAVLVACAVPCVAGQAGDPQYFFEGLGSVAQYDQYMRSIYAGESDCVRFESRRGRVTAVLYECYTG